MKKAIIGGLIGGIVLFLWQFLSWAALNIHGSNMTHTPQQDKIMRALEESGLEEGQYLLPNLAPGYTAEEQEAYAKNMEGKAWAMIHYQKSWSNTMGMNMGRALVINILSAFMLCYLFLGDEKLTFMKVLTGSLMVGLISYLTLPYLNSIWFKTNSIPDLIDTIVQWGLVGVVLGWWLNRK